MPATRDERRLVCRERGTEAGNKPTWFVSGDEQRAVEKKLLIRRDLPWGEVEWFDIRDRDATVDDLVDSHGCLAFETGVFLGLCGCLFEDVLEAFRRPRAEEAEIFEECTYVFEYLRPKLIGKNLRSNSWDAIEPELKLATDLISKSYTYSAAFEPTAAQNFFSAVTAWPRKRMALEACHALLHRIELLIRRPYFAAARLGVLSIVQRWKLFEVTRSPTMSVRKIREIEACCPRTRDALQSSRSSRQCMAAVCYLRTLRPSDYLTFSESLTPFGMAPWSRRVDSACDSQLFPNSIVPVGTHFGSHPRPKKKAGRPTKNVSLSLLMEEFHNKHPYMVSMDFRKAMLREFQLDEAFVDTNDVQNFRKKVKPKAAGEHDPEDADLLLPHSPNRIKHILRLCQLMPGYSRLLTKQKKTLLGLLRELDDLSKTAVLTSKYPESSGTGGLPARGLGMSQLLEAIHAECWPGFRVLPKGQYLVPRIG